MEKEKPSPTPPIGKQTTAFKSAGQPDWLRVRHGVPPQARIIEKARMGELSQLGFTVCLFYLRVWHEHNFRSSIRSQLLLLQSWRFRLRRSPMGDLSAAIFLTGQGRPYFIRCRPCLCNSHGG